LLRQAIDRLNIKFLNQKWVTYQVQLEICSFPWGKTPLLDLEKPQFGTTSDRDMLSNFPSWEGCPEGGVGQIYDHRYPIDYG